MVSSSPHLWLLIDDRPGNATQVRGVAEAWCALRAAQQKEPGTLTEKTIAYTSLAKLPNIVRGASLVGLAPESAAALHVNAGARWPDAVIAAGRRAAPVARWIKTAAARAGQAVKLVHLMNPGRVGAAAFDLIVRPNHDCITPSGDAANVLRITGAPHRFSPARLEAERAAWQDSLNGLPRPYIALLVGGATKQKPFTPAMAADLGARVAALAKSLGGSVLLATSRRTGPEAEAALLAATPEPRAVYLWGRDHARANPYAGYLALADAVVVTGDSVSMCAEACANPGPVYIYAPPDFVTPKHARLHAELYKLGAARPFALAHDLSAHTDWSHPPLNAASDVASRLQDLIAGQAILR